MDEDTNPYFLSSESDSQAEGKWSRVFPDPGMRAFQAEGVICARTWSLRASLSGSTSVRLLHLMKQEISLEKLAASNASPDRGNREPWKGFKQRRGMVRSVIPKGLCGQGGQ